MKLISDGQHTVLINELLVSIRAVTIIITAVIVLFLYDYIKAASVLALKSPLVPLQNMYNVFGKICSPVLIPDTNPCRTLPAISMANECVKNTRTTTGASRKVTPTNIHFLQIWKKIVRVFYLKLFTTSACTASEKGTKQLDVSFVMENMGAPNFFWTSSNLSRPTVLCLVC